jgi:hypothetical protein
MSRRNTAIMPNIAAMRLAAAILILASACCGIAAAEGIPDPVPLPRPRPVMPQGWAEPHSFREAAGPDFNSEDVTDKPSDCDERLGKFAVIVPMPRLIGPGTCGGGDMVRLDAVLLPDKKRIEIKPAPYLRCPMAESLASWVRDEAAPRIGAAGPALRTVDTYDDYDCRGRNRIVGAKMSEHGKGNAVDVRSLTLVDGHAMLLTDIMAPKDLRDGLRESACARFMTVLGPGSDGYHEAHIHLDLAERSNGHRICQWDVREPPPPTVLAYVQFDGKQLPLPPPRPTMTDEAIKQKP